MAGVRTDKTPRSQSSIDEKMSKARTHINGMSFVELLTKLSTVSVDSSASTELVRAYVR
jgi:hypothetical protein